MMTRLQQQIDELRTRMVSLVRQVGTLSVMWDGAINEAQNAQISGLRAELNAHQKTINALLDERTALHQRCDRLESLIAQETQRAREFVLERLESKDG